MAERLTEKQEIILYRLALLQDEQGRQSSMVRLSELENDKGYKELVDLEYLTYEQFGEGKAAIANLIVTLPGMRYCYDHLDEMAALDAKSRQQF